MSFSPTEQKGWTMAGCGPASVSGSSPPPSVTGASQPGDTGRVGGSSSTGSASGPASVSCEEPKE